MSDLTESKVDQEESKEQVVIVTRLETNDVVMGRGAQAVAHQGNISFREIVSSRRQEYFDTAKRKDKDLIARQIAGAVRSRNGRFLRKLDSRLEAEQHGIPRGTSAWTLVDEETVIQKVKQALRDSFQGDDQGGNAQARTRDNDDDNRPSRRRRIGQGNWTSGSAEANPMFQQLAADALREYQEGHAEVSHTLQGRPGAGAEGNQEPEQQFPVPFPSHILGQEYPESGFESRLVGYPNVDLLRAAAHPQERQDSTEVQQQQSQQQDQTFPTGQMPEHDAEDSKPAAS